MKDSDLVLGMRGPPLKPFQAVHPKEIHAVGSNTPGAASSAADFLRSAHATDPVGTAVGTAGHRDTGRPTDAKKKSLRDFFLAVFFLFRDARLKKILGFPNRPPPRKYRRNDKKT